MKDKPIQFVVDETKPPPFLTMTPETKFCHACDGWCVIDMRPCAVCDGRGSVKVALPVVEEAFAE